MARGRKFKIPEDQWLTIARRHEQGESYEALGEEFGVTGATILNTIQRAKIAGRTKTRVGKEGNGGGSILREVERPTLMLTSRMLTKEAGISTVVPQMLEALQAFNKACSSPGDQVSKGRALKAVEDLFPTLVQLRVELGR